MNYSAVVKEKSIKLYQYIKLKWMFLQNSEFKRIHPELIKMWEKKFRQMIRHSSDRTFPIAEEFLNVHFEKVKECNLGSSREEQPILVCALKNDVDKLRFFLKHYRNIGIKHFVFLDNNSDDGSFEYLMEQEDTTVYRCLHEFTANRKIAWINRLLAELGDNKWYLMVDSDEFLAYLGDQEHSLQEVIQLCDKRRYSCVGGLMLDMYSKGGLFHASDKTDIIEQYRYFDRDTYDMIWASNGLKITGGPRKRVFGTSMKLSKYCLFRFTQKDVIPSAHVLIPYEKGMQVPVAMMLLHYKFINKRDFDEIVDAVNTGKHSDDSAEYKSYLKGIQENKKLSFYDERFSEVLSEENLKKIPFIESLF